MCGPDVAIEKIMTEKPVVLLNPGTGDARDYGRVSGAWAYSNAKRFAVEVDADSVIKLRGQPDDGRWPFALVFGRRRVALDMPGCSLARVRYVDPLMQNIWFFPRLYVDGHSLTWLYARSALISRQAAK